MIEEFKRIPFNTEEIEQSVLNIEEKKRSNLFAWNGQFSPQFVESMLRKYSEKGYHVLDPFLGSGTTLYESGLLGLKATGVEINPSAVQISTVYRYINYPVEKKEELINKVESYLSVFHELDYSDDELVKNTFKYFIDISDDEDIIDLIKTFTVLLDYGNKKLNKLIFMNKWESFKLTLLKLPYSPHTIKILNNDARNIELEDNCVDLVITSPPYINVYNYHQQYRKATELLGHNVLKYAKSELGSNRKNRSNRFLTVTQYCLDIAMVLKELSRVCKEGSRIIFVVGRESNVMKTPFYNSALVYELACNVLGMELLVKQERVFKNRFGQNIYEDILQFENHKSASLIDRDELIIDSKNIAKRALESALEYGDDSVQRDIRDAIDALPKTNYSEILKERM